MALIVDEQGVVEPGRTRGPAHTRLTEGGDMLQMGRFAAMGDSRHPHLGGQRRRGR